jgi:class 3 adenylate cyclase
MSLRDDLTSLVDDIAEGRWTTTDGRTVPESEDIGLGNVGSVLEATMLYSDLADSTALVTHNRSIAAEVFKAFLECGTRIILAHDGKVRSFDGDRVMAVFIGDSKNTNAVKAALAINEVFRNVIAPRFGKQYEVFKDGTLALAQCTGIDTGSLLVARAGVRNNNDLVWVGQAANIAAKLSTLREAPYNSWITKAVYDRTSKEMKVSSDGRPIWEHRIWATLPAGRQDIYRSSWWRKL